MKRILSLFALLLVSLVGMAQAPSNYTNINGRYRWIAGMFDSTFSIPKGTTPSLRTGGSSNPGAMFYRTTDSSLYLYTGTQWLKQAGTAGFVPYTGATTNVNLGEYGITSGYTAFDLTPTNTPSTQGTMYWDDSEETVALIMNGTTQKIGLNTFYYVKNSTGSSIPKGTAVRFAGTDGASGHILIAPFTANGTYSSTYFMGVTSEAIDNGDFGKVVNFGKIEGVNTSAYTDGAILYASTSSAGGFQTTVPQAPNNIVQVAAVINAANNGSIIVRPTLGSNINNDEGVKITSPVSNSVLAYNSSSGLWVDTTINALGYVPYTGATSDVTLGNYNLSGGNINAVNYVTGSTLSGLTKSSILSNAYGLLYLKRTANGYLQPNNLTLDRDWYLPDTSGTLALASQLSGYVPTTRTITINGTSQDLSANRTYNVGTVTSVATNTGTGITGGTITTTGTIAADTLLLSTRLWRQKGVDSVIGVLGSRVSGTTNYIPKFTSSSAIGNSVIYESGGKVGIGTTTLLGNLTTTVSDAGGEDGYYISYNAGANKLAQFTVNSNTGEVKIGSTGGYSSFYQTFYTGANQERLRISSTGNVSIGNTNNTYKLDVTGTAFVSGKLYLGASSVFLDYNSGGIDIATGSLAKLNISSTGAATFSSSVTAGAASTINGAYPQLILNNPTAGAGIELHFKDNGTLKSKIGTLDDINSWQIYNGGAIRFTINNSGNVGIGTTSPATAGASYTGLDIRGSTGSSLVFGSTSTLFSYLYADAGALTLQTTSSIPVVFSPGGSERMRITSGGELLINTTSAAAGYKLQVNGSTYINGSLTTTTVNGNNPAWKLGAYGTAISGSNGYAVAVDIGGTVYYLMTAALPEPEPEPQAGPSMGYKAKFEEPIIKLKTESQEIKELKREIEELKQLIKNK